MRTPRPDQPTHVMVEIDARPSSMAALGSRVRDFALAASGRTPDGEPAARLGLAVHELAMNVADHAYDGRGGPLAVELTWDGRILTATLTDRGRPFDPADVPDPDLDEPRERGYGLFLVRQLVDSLDHRRDAGRNTWTITVAEPGPSVDPKA